MNLGSYRKVTVDFGALPIDYDYSQTSPLGLVLCECGIRIVGLEVLDLLEMGFLLYGTHFAVL